jgi:hypothetical protein
MSSLSFYVRIRSFQVKENEQRSLLYDGRYRRYIAFYLTQSVE